MPHAFKGVKDEIRVPVTAEILHERKTEKVKFVAIYKREKHEHNQEMVQQLEERARIQQEIRKGALDPDDVELPGLSDTELLLEYMVGWVLKDVNNDEIEFSDEALVEIMEFVEYREALVKGWWDSVLGKRVLTAKN